jgi:hypothetical protein
LLRNLEVVKAKACWKRQMIVERELGSAELLKAAINYGSRSPDDGNPDMCVPPRSGSNFTISICGTHLGCFIKHSV